MKASQLVMSSHNKVMVRTALADIDFATFDDGSRWLNPFSGAIALIHDSVFKCFIQLI